MNSTSFRLAALVCIPLLWADYAQAEDHMTVWVADTVDESRFSGTVIVAEGAGARTLRYDFIYDAQIISSNNPDTAQLAAVGDDCWHAEVTGSFLSGDDSTAEVIFCERADRAYWSLIDQRSGAIRLPRWVMLSKD